MEDSEDLLCKTQDNKPSNKLDPTGGGNGGGSSKRNFLLDVIRKKEIIVENVKFKDKNDWVDKENCALCELKFNTIKLNKQHHCRICGLSVCKECSTKLINNARSCDFCFLKCNDHKQVRRRKKDLTNITEQIQGLQEAIQRYDENTIDINQQIFLNQEKQKEELKQFALSEGELQSETVRYQQKVEQMKEEIESSKERSTILENESSQNKMDMTELLIQIKKLEIDIESVSSTIDLKNKEVANVKKLLDTVKNSQSFRDLSTMSYRYDSQISQVHSNRVSNDVGHDLTQELSGTIYMGYQMEKIIEGQVEEDEK